MARNHLRIFHGPDDTQEIVLRAAGPNRQGVTVPLSDILAALVHASNQKRAWLHDFAEDPITIPNDLYDVLMAYQQYHRPSA
jgi:hypothetical protein